MSTPTVSNITTFKADRAFKAFTAQLQKLRLTSTAEERDDPPPYTALPPSAPRSRAPPRSPQAIQAHFDFQLFAINEMLGEVNKFETAVAILTDSLRAAQERWNLPLAKILTTMAQRLESIFMSMKQTLTDLRARIAADPTQQPIQAALFSLMVKFERAHKDLHREMFDYIPAMEQEMSRMIILGDDIQIELEKVAERYLADISHM
ncbi:hypothetical protein BGZ47_001213 [Haplosporangium gracile]|nr:hypothetical protein BGZ47_001213 [Haplosporangium gracile]